MKEEKAIEVGNIFPLGTKYSKAFNLQFTNAEGNKELVTMGSYGIGVGRVMATIVETHHDEKGIVWPASVAPYAVHLIALGAKGGDASRVKLQAEPRTIRLETGARVKTAADALYNDLTMAGISVLYDDRDGVSAGEKFADCDLIGIPVRLVVSEKTLEKGGVEFKKRGERETTLVKIDEVVKSLKSV